MVSPGVRLRVDRAAMDRLFKTVQSMDRASAEVGYFDPTPVPGAPFTVPVLAAIQEYGTDSIPARGFMRRGARDALPLLERVAAEEIAKVSDGKQSPTRAMDAIGDAAAGRILDTLENAKQWATPNAPMTVELKGGDTPLLAQHGQLRDELRYRVLDREKVVLTERPRT
jgi:hypothetical protein